MSGLQLDLGPAKEPLGLLRGLQWFFSIFAFATCGGFRGAVTFLVSCHGQPNATVSAAFAYPFRLNQAAFTPPLAAVCNRTWHRDVHLVGDLAPAAQLFVAVAVLAFLYSAAALGLYLGFLRRYRGAGGGLPLANPPALYLGFLRRYRGAGGGLPLATPPALYLGFLRRYRGAGGGLPLATPPALYLGFLRRYRGAGGGLPLADFLATLAFSFLWLVGSSAWAKALADIKVSTAAPLPNCHPPDAACFPAGVTPMGSLNVSVVFGFLNLVLWVGSCWFVYKETNFHRPAPPPSAPPGPGAM